MAFMRAANVVIENPHHAVEPAVTRRPECWDYHPNLRPVAKGGRRFNLRHRVATMYSSNRSIGNGLLNKYP
ncbi:MAG: hypothetical protein V7606_1181 [Burkholderiales bacterium]